MSANHDDFSLESHSELAMPALFESMDPDAPPVTFEVLQEQLRLLEQLAKLREPHEDFVLESYSDHDPSLPLARSVAKRKRPVKPHPYEAAKLEATRKLGGLVPERSVLLDRLCRAVGPLERTNAGGTHHNNPGAS
jgi:hypothetical protein